ncbi:hypothetical protein TSOC_005973, partial [Tetrabaena socialis]
TTFPAVLWEKWQKLSAQISQYKALPRPDYWAAHTQLFDQQLQRLLTNLSTTAAARPDARPAAALAAIRTPSKPLGGAAAAAAAAVASVSNRGPTLTPYLTVADEVEVSFAAMLADLCNMAYEVDKLDAELIEARHHLSLIATSITSGVSCSAVPGSPTATAAVTAAAAGELAAAGAAAAGFVDSGLEAEAQGSSARPQSQVQRQRKRRQQQQQRARRNGSSASSATAADAEHDSYHDLVESGTPGITSFTMGGSPPLSPSISMLQLTSPEAVTAALTSRGHGAAFAHPVYVSTLHHALTSLASYDEEGDISDLEWRAAMAAAGPGGVILSGVGSLGTIGGTMDEIHTQMEAAGQQQLRAGLAVQTVAAADPAAAAAQAAASGTFFSDASLSEERDFLAGHVYGYHTRLVERRSSDGGGAVEEAAVAQSGAAGGRALREEQSLRRRSSAGGPDAVAAALGAAGQEAVANGAPVVMACTKAPPSAWFASDDKLTRTRYFSIQGSTSLEHWQINLQFEPVIFEDAKYGESQKRAKSVRIHRGVYEAAKVLYDDLLPLVMQHIETSPYATVTFTGHSLGGSLGTVLAMLFVMRGVLKPSNISPVYTFGAPAVFCQGAVPDAPADRCANCTLACEMAPTASAASHAACGCGAHGGSAFEAQELPLGLMATLGFADDQVVNVIMHKDIVPRAFVCDYTAVAGVLQRWWPSFRDLHSLQDEAGPHKSLYNFVGRVAVLRPGPDLPFVHGPADAAHPMLPNYPALYRVGLHESALPIFDHAAASMASWDELLDGSVFAAAMSAMADGCRQLGGAAAASASAAQRAEKLAGLQQSVLHFMNQPHPLATLSDYQAYGPNGCISRFHNPDNYTRALYGLLGR